MGERTRFVDGKDVPMRPWQVGLANMSEPSLARFMRGLIACAGQITDMHGVGGRRFGYADDWRGSLVAMVRLPDGFLAKFREAARPIDVSPPSRIQVGTRGYSCGEFADNGVPCEEKCPPGHHGGTEWRAVLAEPRR